VVIVGNLSVGGTGKTPFVIWLAALLKASGFHPGILSRGYRGRSRDWPRLVDADSDPADVGDEPVLIAQRSACPLAAGPDRCADGRALLAHAPCDILICDDGLQHYRLERDLEILLIDGKRRFGNGFCLPSGPLREPAKRAAETDIRVVNGQGTRDEFYFNLAASPLRQVRDPKRQQPLSWLQGQRVHAVAGIGAPERFFRMLLDLGAAVIEHPFADHYHYQGPELSFADGLPIVMTEKDAVKCISFAPDDCWSLVVDVQPGPGLADTILNAVRKIADGR
jgi:tetraacyldisaccharide 4'-kinase